MLKPLAAVFAILFASHALAEDCPRFYRFVDFGIEGDDGVIYRGGPAFRVEGFDGHLLVHATRTQCLGVRDVLADGHGNPIPVVASIDYDPVRTGADLIALRVAKADDLRTVAEENAAAHRANLEQVGAVETRGESSLCVRRDGWLIPVFRSYRRIPGMRHWLSTATQRSAECLSWRWLTTFSRPLNGSVDRHSQVRWLGLKSSNGSMPFANS